MVVYVRRKATGQEVVFGANDWAKRSPQIKSLYELSTQEAYSAMHPTSKYSTTKGVADNRVVAAVQKKSENVVDETLAPAKKLTDIMKPATKTVGRPKKTGRK